MADRNERHVRKSLCPSLFLALLTCITEAAWGSDPTEDYGGFRNLAHNVSATYRSSIANGGTITWDTVVAELDAGELVRTSARLEIAFADVDWPLLQTVYGWAALQWQAWARGSIFVDLDTNSFEDFVLHTEGILEFWIDEQHYFGGDFYSFHRSPVPLRLERGLHTIDVRLIRDVRAMGGIGAPSLDVKLSLVRASATLRDTSGLLISDVVAEKGKLGSPHASLYLLNEGKQGINVRCLRWSSRFCSFSSQTSLYIAPGQTRPLQFQIDCNLTQTSDANLEIIWDHGDEADAELLSLRPTLHQRALHEPQKITFLHPSGIVSYAIMRPPSLNALHRCMKSERLPVLLALHGAGLEADDELVKHSLDPLPDLCGWVVFPTGVTAWSGDDWHVWGLADVEAAVSAINEWIGQVEWDGASVAVDKWLVTGHSNGGQGTWYALTHRPDNVFAAAPLSGYSSIQNYVPYSLWQPADQGRTAIVQASLNTYKHEILLDNAKGIPVFQQHGGADDNVPAYHSRLLSQLLQHAGVESRYVEAPGKPHWWDGVMTTDQLSAFFKTELEMFEDHATSPVLEWALLTSNPVNTGPKYGIEILQLINAGQLGKVSVQLNPTEVSCIIHTSNIQAFKVGSTSWKCKTMVLDDISVDIPDVSAGYVVAVKAPGSTSSWFISHYDGRFTNKSTLSLSKQNVGLDGILRTSGAFQIVQHTQGKQAMDVALQISRNLCQYFAADTELGVDYHTAKQAKGNIISVAVGADLPAAGEGYETISVGGSGLCVQEDRRSHCYGGSGHLGAVFLRPLSGNRLELVVWAEQARNLGLAARLVPTLTGVGQPDFIVLGNSLSKGLENAVALGFYDANWGISRNAFFS